MNYNFNTINIDHIRSIQLLDRIRELYTGLLKTEVDKCNIKLEKLYRLNMKLQQDYIKKSQELMSKGVTY